MKKEKKYFVLIILLIVVIIALFTIIFIVSKDDKEPTTDSNPIVDKDNTLSCTKDHENTEIYTSIEKYVLTYTEDGMLTKYIDQYIYAYKTKEEYDKVIKADFAEIVKEFDDDKKQVTVTYQYDKVVNNEGVELHLWCKDFQKSLENKGFVCK